MVLKGFPDWIQYNNIQAAKGRPKVSWPEYQRLRKYAKASQGLTDLQKVGDGVYARSEVIYQPEEKAPVEPPERLSEELLLTEDMIAPVESPELAEFDASGLIGSI